MQEQRDSGVAMFARYAYPPNELGYCGPSDTGSLLDSARQAAHSGGSDLYELAKQFDGAWCYLETLAAGTGYSDPLGYPVVEAYWLGNALLDRLDGEYFAKAVTRRFHGQYGARMAGLATTSGEAAPARAHHGFHVFEVYPWSGMLGAGDGAPALSVLDQCRIRWGRVLGFKGERAIVRSRRLAWDGRRLTLGRPSTETPRWVVRGWPMPREPSVGDWVALHWDWICDTLSPRQLIELRYRTARQLELTNHTMGASASRAS